MTDTAKVGAAILLLGVIAVIGGTVVDPNSTTLFDAVLIFYANAGSELISIAITVLIIDRLNHRRDQNERQQELVDNQDLQQRIANDLARQLRGYMQGQALSRLRQCLSPEDRQPVLDEMAQNNLLKGLDLSHTELTRAGLWGARMHGINLKGANLHYAHLKNAHLPRADLRDADLSYCDLRKIDLTEATIEGATFTHSRFERTDLTGVNFYNTTLAECAFHKANLSEANLQSVDLTSVQAEEATFDRARLVGVRGSGGVFTASTFIGADLRGAVLVDAILTDANFLSADLRNADFTGADLTGASFKRAQGVTVEQLSAATSCAGLTLPDGFVLPAAWREALEKWQGLPQAGR